MTARQQASHSLVKALREVPGLDALDETTLLGIVGDSANLFWPAGEVVMERGGESDGLYVVVSGCLEVVDEDGRELAVLGHGDYFGEFALLDDLPHEQDVRTLEDSELMVVPKERFDELVGAHPELGRSIRETADERRRLNRERPEARVSQPPPLP
jgi:CRP-like cAMP-binding protein